MGFELAIQSRDEDAASYSPTPVMVSVWAEGFWCKLEDPTSLQPQQQGKEKQGGMSRWGRDPAMLLRWPTAELWQPGVTYICLGVAPRCAGSSVSPLFRPSAGTPAATAQPETLMG